VFCCTSRDSVGRQVHGHVYFSLSLSLEWEVDVFRCITLESEVSSEPRQCQFLFV
jgi:hypothetical protein